NEHQSKLGSEWPTELQMREAKFTNSAIDGENAAPITGSRRGRRIPVSECTKWIMNIEFKRSEGLNF
ncbi:hypothetical protein HAX54_013603, partial [Datura stramonium]|nr:hypothetical protein [Datura stramonium]